MYVNDNGSIANRRAKHQIDSLGDRAVQVLDQVVRRCSVDLAYPWALYTVRSPLQAIHNRYQSVIDR